jgi:hypothetical protein
VALMQVLLLLASFFLAFMLNIARLTLISAVLQHLRSEAENGVPRQFQLPITSHAADTE